MSSVNGVSSRVRVSIPINMRKTIQHIREITGKQHTDDEIYAVLRECSMDPNDTAQKLLYLDAFHEVTRRRDRKKEGLSSEDLEDSSSRMKRGLGRGGGVASSGYASNFFDGGGGRNLVSRRENGINHIKGRSREHSTQPFSQNIRKNPKSQPIRVSVVASNGPVSQSNGNSGLGFSDQPFIGSGISVSKSSSAIVDTKNAENVQPQVAVAAASSLIQTSGSVTSIDQGKSLSNSDQLPTSVSSASVSVVYSSSSDPVLAPSVSQNPGISSAINREVSCKCLNAGPYHVQGNKIVLHEVVDLSSPKNKSGSMNSTSKDKAQNESNEAEKNKLCETSNLLSSLSRNGSLRPSFNSGSQPHPVSETVKASETSDVRMQSSAELRQHVTFPTHFHVPETLKAGLTFGSFHNFGPRERSSIGTGGDNNTSALKSSPGRDETATSSNQTASLSAQGDHIEYPHSPSNLVEKTQALGNSITVVSELNGDQPKEVLLAPNGLPIQNVQNAQNYGLNFMPTMLGTQQVRFEGAESQAPEISHLPTFVSASSQAVSSPSPTPSLQSSIPVSPHSIPIFRPPYPPNFFPYGHYYPHIYLSPMHQFLSHNGFPPQPPVGNMYLPPPAAGIKYPLPQFQAGANTGAMAHIGIPPASFITPPAGYAPSPTVNTGSSNGNEDLAVSQSKENHIYTTGQLNEGSGVWIPAPGQDISNLHVNSLYNFSPQGHFAFPPTQSSHVAFAGGIYQPGQIVASPSTLLQQSQAVSGPVESVGAPSGAYQQPQHAQINWNSNS